MVEFLIEKNPFSTNPQIASLANLYGSAILKLNQLNKVSLFAPYYKKTISNMVDLNDHIILKTINRDYKFIVERLRYTDTQLEIIGTDISLIASNKQVFDLLYQNYNMLDVVAGKRDGPLLNPSVDSQIDITSSSTSDVDMTVTVYGLTNTGSYKSEDIALKGTTTVTTTTTFSELWYIKNSKVTNGILTIEDSAATVLGKLNIAGQRLANTDVVGNYGNSITYKLYSDATPNMAVKTAESFDNFNGGSESSGWTKTGSSANSTSWSSEGSHSMNIPASSSITKTIDFGTSNKIYQMEFDVYVDTVGTFTVDINSVTVATINSGAGSWQTIRIDTSGQTGSQLVELISAAGTDVYIDSIRLFNSDYIEEYTDDPIPAINFNGNNGLQAINKLAQFCVVSSTDKSYDWDIRDLEDGQTWNISKPVQLYLKPSLGSGTVVDTFSNKAYSGDMMLDKDSSQIINRVTVYGGGDGVFKKFATAEDTTSQATYGIRSPETPPNYPELSDDTELQRIADAIVQKFKDPFVRLDVGLTVSDTKANLGDTVKLINEIIQVNEDQRVIGLNYSIDQRMSEVEATRTRDALNTRRRGAVNMYMTGETQNVDTNFPMDIDFFVPANVTEINSMLLNYAVQPYRTFQGAIPIDSNAEGYLSWDYEFKYTGTGTYTFGFSFPAPATRAGSSEGTLDFVLRFHNRHGSTVTATSAAISIYNNSVSGYEELTSSSLSIADDTVTTFTIENLTLTSDDWINASGNVIVRFVLTTLSNAQNSTLNFLYRLVGNHDHDNFPVINDIPKASGLAMNIEISESGGAFTDYTTQLELLYGTLHTSDIGASSEKTYDLTQVKTFNADKWYTVRLKPTSSSQMWLDCDATTGGDVAGVFSTLTQDLVRKTEGTASMKFIQATSSGYGQCAIDSTLAFGGDLDLTGYRYITFDLWLDDTPANLNIDRLTVYFPSTEYEATNPASDNAPSRGMLSYRIDTTNLASGWNTGITFDLQGDHTTGSFDTYLMGGVNVDISNIQAFILRVLFDSAVGSTQEWNVDNIQYLADGQSRVRADLFNEFYLETGGTV